MHESAIYPSVIERVVQRRGGVAVFDRLDSKRTAHIVVDLQNGFMAPGAAAEIAEARAIVPTVNRISEAVREAGGLVVYIQNTFDAEAHPDLVDLLRSFLLTHTPRAHDRGVHARCRGPRALAGPRCATGGP